MLLTGLDRSVQDKSSVPSVLGKDVEMWPRDILETVQFGTFVPI